MDYNYGYGYCLFYDDIINTTDVVLSGRAIVLKIDSTALSNGDTLYIKIAQDIPSINDLTYIPNVVVEVDGLGIYDIIQTVSCNIYGTPNKLYADQLARVRCACTSSEEFVSNQILAIRFATDTEMFNYVGNRKPLHLTKAITSLDSTDTSE